MMTEEWSFGPRPESRSIDLRRTRGSIDLRKIGWPLIFIAVTAAGAWLFWALLDVANRLVAT
jgi:hypothetical protein